MKIVDVAQGTPEWLALRAGKVTASRLSDLMATIKSGEAASRRDYKAQIAVELLTGTPMESSFYSPEMKWGNDQEPFARAAYEVDQGVMVDQVGFVLHPVIDRAGASPDGLVGEDGLLEIKAPKSSTHLDYIVANEVPEKYKLQMLWQMDCCTRQWCDFVSFDPRMPAHLQLFVKRFEVDYVRIMKMRESVQIFLSEVDELLAKLPKAVQ